MGFEFIDEIVDLFARDPIGPRLSLPRIANNPRAAIRDTLQAQLELIPTDLVDVTKTDKAFCFFYPESDSRARDRNARTWLLIQGLGHEIPRRRLAELQKPDAPIHSHPALSGIRADDEGLFPLDAFEIQGGLLYRRSHAFTIAPQVESPNASYWLTLTLRKTGTWKRARIRLDPFLHGPADEFPMMTYTMWWWGTAQSWNQMKSRAGGNFGVWGPDPLTHGVQRTEYVWSSRRDEGHFQLEELPSQDCLETRGARYCHAIYDSTRECVVHLDGALRILPPDEWKARTCTHLKDAGKVGARLKIFRLDEAMSDEALAALCASYFVWNEDVRKFFDADERNVV